MGFGVLFLRALVWGALLAGVGLGADFLVRRYLPELVAQEASTPQPESETDGVDITIDEENPHEQTEVPGAEAVAGAEAETGGSIDHGAAEEDVEELAVEVDEDDGQEGGPQAHDSDPGLPSFDGLETAFGSAAGESAELAAEPGDESVQSSEQSSMDSDGGPLMSDEDTPARAESVDVLGVEEDPEVVAKAVRTLMQKDERG